MTEKREEELEQENQGSEQLPETEQDSLEPEWYEFTQDSSQDTSTIELSEERSVPDNGNDDDSEDSSSDSLEPEYVEKDDDNARSSEKS